MKMTKLAVAVGALALSGAALAEISANIGLTSNYVWRGQTQTNNGPAISGGLDYAHASGFYAGTWASNVDFDADDPTTAEVDFYGGFSNEIGGLSYDVGVVYYAYPGGMDLDFTDVYGSLSVGPITAGVYYTVDKESGVDENDVYYYVGASTEIAPTWSLGGTVGFYDYDSGEEYKHAQIDVGKSAGDFGDFTLSVSVLDDDDGLGLDGDPLVFVSWGKTF